MSNLFLGLAILSVAWGIVSSIVIASYLSRRGIKINLLFFRIMMLKYIHQYHQITRQENGKPGPWFYSYVVSMLLALAFAALGLGLLTVSLLGAVLCCESEKNSPTEPSQEEYHYTIPEQTNDGWETDSLAGVGMDPAPLVELMDRLADTEGHEVHSLLIVRDGKLVFEEYFRGEKFKNLQFTGEWGFDRDDTHNLCSVTKSFTSALVGIAIDKGLIGSVDEKVFDFFPENADLMDDDSLKADLTIEDLLTMRSGIDWDDQTYPYDDPRNDIRGMVNARNPLRYILFKDILVTPGTVFQYRNCNSILLGDIVRRVSGERLDVFSEDYLFSKIGVTDYEWQLINADVVCAHGDIQLRPRDMAKFGLLFLNGGSWDGQQVISPEWGEQWIVVWPQANMVIVTTGGNYYSAPPVLMQVMLVDYILPAMEVRI